MTARIDKQGEGRITGADVQLPPNLQIVSPEKPIVSLSRTDTRFDAVLTIESGKGLCAVRHAGAFQDHRHPPD